MAGEKDRGGAAQEVGRLKVWLGVGGGDSVALGREGSCEYGEVFSSGDQKNMMMGREKMQNLKPQQQKIT